MFKLKPVLFNFVFSLSLVGSVGLSRAVLAQESAGVMPGLRIDSLGYKGAGCPRGSVATTVSPDNSALSFLFSSFSFDVRQGVQDGRNCNLRFQVTPPVGYQLKVVKIDYRGFAALSSGATARMNSQVLQQGSGTVRTIGETNHDFAGPMNDVFLLTAGSADGAWTSCSGQPVVFNISSWLEVINRSNDVATMSVDSGDMSMAPGTTFYLAWAKCSGLRPELPREMPREIPRAIRRFR